MSKVLERRNTIYGICAIWIVLFHVFRKIGMPYIPVITNIIGIGNMAVDVFFLFSGWCLALSAKKHNYPATRWKGYYKRRLTRVILPYLIICIPFYLWSAICKSEGDVFRKTAVFLANISSVTFWLKGTQTTWYVYGIVLFYILFPMLYSFLVKAEWKKRVLIIIGMAVFAVCTTYIPVLKNSMIVWARLPIFTIGIIIGIVNEKRTVTKVNRIILFLVLCILAYIVSLSEISESFSIAQVYRLLIYIPMTLALVILLSESNRKIKAFEWVGSFSLEVYLIHITLLHPIQYYGIQDILNYWLYFFLPVISVFFAWIVAKIERIALWKTEGSYKV